MKLEEKINDRKIAYFFRKEPSIAFQLALFYYILAKRKNSSAKVADAILRALYWLKKSEVVVPEYVRQLSPWGQLEEIENILVLNKAKIDAQACAPAVTPGQLRQLGLA